MKKCPFCAEEIQDEAIICRFCGRDFSIVPLQVGFDDREKLVKKLAVLEKNHVVFEGYLQEQIYLGQRASQKKNWAIIWILIGLFLAPVLIGVVIIVIAWVDFGSQGAKLRLAEVNQAKARRDMEIVSKQIIDIKTALETRIYTPEFIQRTLELVVPNVESISVSPIIYSPKKLMLTDQTSHKKLIEKTKRNNASRIVLTSAVTLFFLFILAIVAFGLLLLLLMPILFSTQPNLVLYLHSFLFL